MLVTVFCAPRDRSEITFSLEVSPDLELRDFIALCELESGIPAGEIQISYADQRLQDPTRTLGAYGLKDGDVVVLRQVERRPSAQPNFPGLPRIDFSSISVPGTSSGQPPAIVPQPQRQNQRHDSPPQPPSLTGSASSPQGLDNPSLLREMLLANPHELSLLKERNPPLADALLSGDLERFTKVLVEQQQERARREQERIRLLTSDPFDLEAQAKIEEDIRQHNIEENMTIAMEEAPESFGQVVMLYINCKVNGHPVKAFVDSGAQMTIMSQACAERCNIMRLVDRRWAGIAKGVGTQKIIGRVHLAQVQIEGDFLPCSFSILEDQPMDMLLGLDMLKRHQCSIDLKKSVLLIGTTGSETRFLPEAELPDCARLAYGADARPEEIADRELAEALQRSAQESDIEDGQTTSPQSLPLTLPTHNDKIPMTSSPDRPQNPVLDRSKSAPASLHHPLPDGTPRSEPSQSQSYFQGLNEPSSTPLVTGEVVVPQLDSSCHVASSSPEDVPACASPDDDASRQSGILESVEGLPPTAMEVGTAAGEEEEQSGPLATLAHLDLVQDGTDADLPLPIETELLVSHERLSAQSETEAMDAEVQGVGSLCPPQLPRHASPLSDVHLGTSGPDSSSETLSESSPHGAEMTDLPVSAEDVYQLERGLPEGDQQPGSDSMPSLAAALMELHELLMSSGQPPSRSRDHSPLPSAWCREDADGLNEGCEPGSLVSTWGHAPLIAPAASATETSGADFEDSLNASNVSVNFESVDSDQVEGFERGELEECREGQEVRVWGAQGGGQTHSSMAEKQETGYEPEEDPVPQTSLDSMEVRQPPEGQLGRGVADGRAAGPEPSSPFQLQSPSGEVFSPSHEQPFLNTLCHTAALDEVSSPSPTGSGSCTPTSVPNAAPLPQPFSPPPAAVSPLAPPSALTERFPLAHIQRIQEAGFSAGEATEALEQAEGIVDLALLKLLARKITVPT